MSCTGRWGRAACLWGAVAIPAGAGTPPVQDPPPPQQEPAQSDRFQFSVAVENVTLDVVVTDRRGRFVPDLSEEEFEILEEGVPQRLSYFTSSNTPVSTLLLLDSSSSVRSSIGAIQTGAYLFVKNLGPADKARVGLFHSQVHYGPPFSRDLAVHLGTIRSMRPQGKTALYDAILSALDELSAIEGRKALLVFTDGDDSGPEGQGSAAALEDAIEGGKLSDASIYTVGFSGWRPTEGSGVNRGFLTRLAAESGGRAFFPDDLDEIRKSFSQIQEELHHQYRMAYRPRAPSEELEWRTIQIRLPNRKDLSVRTRLGYYSGRGPSPDESR